MPSSRIRVVNLLPGLRAAGLEVSTCVYPKRLREKWAMFRQCRKADIVVLQKKIPTPPESRLLRMHCKRLAYDFDDAVYLPHDAGDKKRSRSREAKFAGVLRVADFAIAGNRVLAEAVLPFNKPVHIVPSAVETRGIAVKQSYQAEGPFVVGWVGGKVNLPHLNLLAPVLQEIARAHPLTLRILSNGTLEMPGVDVDFRPWRLETQEREIAGFDAGVMPLSDSPHAAGKCGYKALQYMASAVPAVVSDVGVNRDIVSNGAGFVAATGAEFRDCLENLIASGELRAATGRKGRQRVEEEYSVEAVGGRLAEVLSQSLESNAPSTPRPEA